MVDIGRISEEAKRRGVDPVAAIAEARRLTASVSEAQSKLPSGLTRPVADHLLIGFLPFIRVRELRTTWLGLPDPIPDDDLTCGEYVARHGGAASSTVAGDDV